MKLGLDIHGVLDKNPKFFSMLTHSVMWDIYIITGGSVKEGTILEELKMMNIRYDKIFSVYDHLKSIGEKTNEELGIASQFPFPDEVWNKVKAVYCKENKIDMMFDDMPEYLQYFTTPNILVKNT